VFRILTREAHITCEANITHKVRITFRKRNTSFQKQKHFLRSAQITDKAYLKREIGFVFCKEIAKT